MTCNSYFAKLVGLEGLVSLSYMLLKYNPFVTNILRFISPIHFGLSIRKVIGYGKNVLN